VQPEFAEMVNAGRFKKRSASFLMPDTKGNPTPGKFYLRHVGFLGAQGPAVKGLKDFQFADEGEGVAEFSEASNSWGWNVIADLFRSVRDSLIERDGVEKADRIIPSYQIDSLRQAAANTSTEITDVTEKKDDNQGGDDKSAQFAAREAELATTHTQLTEREKTLADREAKAAREDASEFAEGLVKAGKLLPRQKAPIVELLLAVPANQSLSFAEGDATVEKPAGDVLRELLTNNPVQVDFSEKSGGEVPGPSADFAAPANALVDPVALEIRNKAKAYMKEHPNVSFIEAVKAVGG